MHSKRHVLFVTLLGSLLFCIAALGQTELARDEDRDKSIPPRSKVFITPIEGGFEIYLAAALVKKDVPLVIVNDRSRADFEITGISESEKAGWAKMLFLSSQQSNEQASMKVVNLKSEVIAFAYAVNKVNSVRGKQSAAEACAKHLKDKIEKNE
jgi:hypothetical protein